MSRIGRAPVAIPKGVEVTLQGSLLAVKGPLGRLERGLHPAMIVSQDAGVVMVQRPNDTKQHRALHGLTRALIQNMITGVTQGFKKELEIVGVGFRAEGKPKGVLLSVGYSHGVFVESPAGIKIEVPKPTSIVVTGCDAELVGLVAAEIRAVRRPEPYKGKGIRYIDEQVRRKAGKTAK